jgi:hypothetical protein
MRRFKAAVRCFTALAAFASLAVPLAAAPNASAAAAKLAPLFKPSTNTDPSRARQSYRFFYCAAIIKASN